MSAMQRRKGAGHEREVVRLLKMSGYMSARNLAQVRDGGGDIPFGDWLIECKRRARIGLYEWFKQCETAAKLRAVPYKPLLVIRADDKENLVVMKLTDFLALMKGTTDATTPLRRADRTDTQNRPET